MSEAHSTIAYDGPALEQGSMDVRDLAPALIAVGDLCSRANRLLNGTRATVDVRVKTGFKPGSFMVDLTVVHSVIGQAKALLLSDSVHAALNLAGLIGIVVGVRVSLLRLIKWLRGRAPLSVQTIDTGEVRITVRVEFEHRLTVEYIDVPAEVAKLYNDQGIRQAAEQVVAPLQREGIDTFEVRDAETRAVIETVTKADLPAFSAPAVAERRVVASEYETILQIVKPSFEERLKWTFSDGGTNFFADIEDEEFFGEVQRRERSFAKGDLLRVILLAESFVNERGQISTVRTVRRVIEQIQPPTQLPLV